MNTKKQERRERTLTRLESQLSSGVKNTKEGTLPLDDNDRKRINQEIKTLKSRI